ncbi:MAG: VWA domain-containing protein [Actinomycetota bacterium]|nr:VWA domain-containing protein [Actinomycetota bacterium]
MNWPKGSGNTKAGAGRGTCTGAMKLAVIAAPSIAPAVSSIAAKWQAEHASVDGVCLQVNVAALASREAEQTLPGLGTGVVWIPDSSVWSSRLVTDSPDIARYVSVGKSVASSPLVVAAAPSRLAAVNAAAKKGWNGVLTATVPVAVPSPTDTTEGALTLLSLRGQLGTSAAAADTMGETFLQLGARVVPNSAAGFSAAKDFPTTAPAFVASEQEVINANAGASAPVATAVYPSGSGAALDFPFVSVTRSRTTIYGHALTALQARLAQPAAAQALNAVNLRDSAAHPIQKGADTAASGNTAVTLIPQPSPASLTGVLRSWVAAGADNQFLAVIDVSGSMKDDSGSGQSKIDIASQAATAAITLMPDVWSAGLWIFSRKPAPGTDWTQLVPLGPLQSNRTALLTGARSMPGRAGGDTALYATALNAFKTVSAQYKANKVNSVILMTDGANVDPDDLNLPALITALKARFDPKRPVNINTIALGADADVSALQQISAATAGRTYVVRKPQDIRSVFVRVALHSS